MMNGQQSLVDLYCCPSIWSFSVNHYEIFAFDSLCVIKTAVMNALRIDNWSIAEREKETDRMGRSTYNRLVNCDKANVCDIRNGPRIENARLGFQ